MISSMFSIQNKYF